MIREGLHSTISKLFDELSKEKPFLPSFNYIESKLSDGNQVNYHLKNEKKSARAMFRDNVIYICKVLNEANYSFDNLYELKHISEKVLADEFSSIEE